MAMNDIDPLVLGQRIRQLRMTKGKSQVAMGQYLGRTHAAMSDIERGKTNITVQDLSKIATFLGVTVNDILQEPVTTGAHYEKYRFAKDVTPEEQQQAKSSIDDFKKRVQELNKNDKPS